MACTKLMPPSTQAERARQDALPDVDDDHAKCNILFDALNETLLNMLRTVKRAGYVDTRKFRIPYVHSLFYFVFMYVDMDGGVLYKNLLARLQNDYDELRNEAILSLSLDTYEEVLSKIEEEKGSTWAVAYLLMTHNMYLLKDDDRESISRLQLNMIQQMFKVINLCGAIDWIRADGTSSVDGQDRVRIEFEELDKLPVPPKLEPPQERGPLQTFEYTAQLCVMRNELIRRISILNERLNKEYIEISYYEKRFQYHQPATAGERAKTVVLTWFVVFIVISFWGMGDLWSVFSVALAIGAFVLIRKFDNRQAKILADRDLDVYHRAHMELEENREKWTNELNTYKELLRKDTDILRELAPEGGVPERYWEQGGELWQLVSMNRADSLKEAINLYEQIEMYKAIGNAIDAQNAKILEMGRQVERQAQEQAILSSKQDDLELRQGFDEFLMLYLNTR